MKARYYPAMFLRESRGSLGRLAYFVLCLAVGVAAVVAVSALASSVDRGIRSEAKTLLAGDLVVRGRGELPEEFAEKLRESGQRLGPIERADLREQIAVAAVPPRGERPGASQLIELKVVDGRYPFYGSLELSPPGRLAERLGADQALVGPDLMARLELQVGDSLRVGSGTFTVSGTVDGEPERSLQAFTFAPRVMLDAEGFSRTGLTEVGQVQRRTLLALPEGSDPSEVTRLARELREMLPRELFRVETYRDAQPWLRRSIDRLERFLSLVALLSLLIGGVGVAQTVRAWIATRIDSLAVLKVLGMRPREILALYFGQVMLLAVIGSLAGAVLGMALQWYLPRFWSDLVPQGLLRPWQPMAMLEGVVLGVGVAALFSLPPLGAILRVPAARVLRRDAEALPARRVTAIVTGLLIVFGVATLALVESRSLALAWRFTGVVLATSLGLMAAAAGVTRLAARLPRDHALVRGRVALRYGIAALARPGATTLSAIVALGLGLLVVATMTLVEGQLTDQLRAELPENAPSAFLTDIQKDQWPQIERILDEAGAVSSQVVPVITARLTEIEGQAVADLVERTEDGGRRWAMSRQQRLTSVENLPTDNVLLEGPKDGSLWGDPERAEISLEREFAEELGVGVGSRLVFDVEGQSFDFVVSSIRQVDWEGMSINFYLIAEPGVLDEVPQLRLGAVRLPAGSEQGVQDRLAQRFPNVSMIQMRPLIDRVVGLLERLGWAVRFLGGFTVVAGLVILAGAVAAGSVQRGREVALLKALGMTRRDVLAVLSTEYGLLGLVAGVISALGATLLAWLVVTRGMQIEWSLRPLSMVATVASGILLAVAAGVSASGGALRKRPVEALREE